MRFRTECPKELKLIIEILSLEFKPNTEFIIPDNLDENEFIFWLKRHKVVGSAYHLIKKFGLPFSDVLLNELKSYQENNSLRALKHVNELVLLKNKFNQSDLSFIPVKGVILSKKLYGDFGQRYAGDIDLLIHFEDFKKADQIMIDNGYLRLEFDGFKFERMEVHLSLSHELTYVHYEKSITVELTRSLSSHFYDPELLNSYNLDDLQIGKTNLKVLKNENDFIELCIHGCGHLWERLQWLYDIATYLKKNELDWDCVYKLAVEKEVEELLLASLILCQHIFDTPIPNQLKSMPSSKKVLKLNSYAKDYVASRNHKANSMTLRVKRVVFISTLPKKPNYYQCLKKLLYNVDDWRSINFRPQFYFMYFLLRPFFYLQRVIKHYKNVDNIN
ncbi:nucleotidyltransferase family protein [Lentisphaera marina]|uniref:nucleotidyltransferase domain-containing protein n=1 Tax=Lentisphaera marina TaxID=1111041 RepID=UPI002366AAA4|nr:nucleotidyltransferase family protein [Lentisphaera marina]MDD7986909.1 nucleotidyltransferase family protein [Lentisphaera marina]